MFTNHSTNDTYEKNVENGGERSEREREREREKEREEILLKQEEAVRRCSSR